MRLSQRSVAHLHPEVKPPPELSQGRLHHRPSCLGSPSPDRLGILVMLWKARRLKCTERKHQQTNVTIDWLSAGAQCAAVPQGAHVSQQVWTVQCVKLSQKVSNAKCINSYRDTFSVFFLILANNEEPVLMLIVSFCEALHNFTLIATSCEVTLHWAFLVLIVFCVWSTLMLQQSVMIKSCPANRRSSIKAAKCEDDNR